MAKDRVLFLFVLITQLFHKSKQHFTNQLGCDNLSLLCWIVDRCNLYKVTAHHVHIGAGNQMHGFEQLFGCNPASFSSTGTRCGRRIEHVDIDGYIDRTTADLRQGLL
ncbi:hypothetical protein D3C81_1676850 [compost metagenome]